MRLWDGLRQPGRYPYPPNTFCGSYNNGEISVRKLSTNAASEIEYLTPNSHPQSTFTITYKYVNMGELKKTSPLGRSPGQDTLLCMHDSSSPSGVMHSQVSWHLKDELLTSVTSSGCYCCWLFFSDQEAQTYPYQLYHHMHLSTTAGKKPFNRIPINPQVNFYL